jgi:ligand-binding sensor domain-containing protein
LPVAISLAMLLLSFLVVNQSRTFDLNRRIVRTFRICLLVALSCSPLLALDPNQPLDQLYHTSWNAKDGLNGSVTALAQTADGYLWIGTSDGLFRFDGLYFERYKPESGSLPSVSVSALLALPDGGLWIGYLKGGATFLKSGEVTNYSDREGFPVGRVRCFAQDSDGTIWAGVVGGFSRLAGAQWQTIRMDWNYPSRSAWTLFVDQQGTLWVSTGKGIMFLPKRETKFQDTGLQTGAVFSFARAPDGTILFHDNDQNSLRAFRSPRDSRNDQLLNIRIPARGILFDRQGAMWLVGDGLSRVAFPERLRGQEISESSSAVERLTEAQGLTDNVAETILEDREGNIWVGTDGGLDRFRYRNLSWFPFPAGTNYFSLVAGDNGDVWAGSIGDIPWPMARVPNGKPAKGAPTNVYLTYRDPDGVTWISARGRLWRWDGGEFVRILPPEEMMKLAGSSATKDPITVSSITKDRSGTMWFSFGGGGEFQLKDGSWKFIEILKDHPDWASNAAFTDAANRVWLAYADRVAVVDQGKVRIFSAAYGLTVGPFNIIAGRDQQIWVGGESGLAFLHGDRFHTLHGADGSGFASITGMVVTSNDGLWLSAGPGIVHIPEREIQTALQNFDYKVNHEVFDLVSDLPEQLQRGGVYSSGAIQGSDGLLWFATRSGIARVDPAHIFKNPLPPPVAIRSIVADEKSYSTFANAKLPPLTKTLRIDYTALSLSIPERVRFRYRLDGWDKEWHEVGTRRQAFYTNLAPGNYSFHVIACNNDGVWNEEGATLAFTIAPTWYQTSWFQFIFALSLLFVVWIIYRLRVQQIASDIDSRFNERLAERTRLARELHDTFLQTIQGSKMVADDALEQPTDSGRLLWAMTRLSEWLGRATEEGRAALNSLRTSTTQGNDLAESLRRATEDGLIPTSMTVIFSVVGNAREMHPIVRDEVYRIGYEAIRNAAMHSGASSLEIEIRYAQNLAVRVGDNGIGIDPSLSDKGKEGHFGLKGMRERAHRIGARLTLVSSATSGTAVTVVVPGRIVFRKASPSRFAWIKSFLKRTGGTSDRH